MYALVDWILRSVRRSPNCHLFNLFSLNIFQCQTSSMVLQRGHIEFDELVSHFKQNSHVLNQLNESLPSEEKKKTLLEKFLEGDDLK